MINEYQFSEILSINNNKIKIRNKTLFGSPMKKFINRIYNQFEIPKESFIISLFYLYNYYNLNKNNNNLIEHFFNNINIYIFTSIIISLKQLLDELFNIRQMCELLNIDYILFTKTEKILLEGINWKTSFTNEDYSKFKMIMEHYKD